MIPVRSGHAVGRGWAYYDRPLGVTWHWTATKSTAAALRLLGGPNALRKGRASAHYVVPFERDATVERLVSLENRSWHAGVNQSLRAIDGKRRRLQRDKASRTTVGVEVVNYGYMRGAGPFDAEVEWLQVYDTLGNVMLVPEWPERQIALCADVVEEIGERWPALRYFGHHHHGDICPGYKVDAYSLPLSRVLAYGAYAKPPCDVTYAAVELHKLHEAFTTLDKSRMYRLPLKVRQAALSKLGYDLGKWGVDGSWGRISQGALLEFQKRESLVVNGHWTIFVTQAVRTALLRMSPGDLDTDRLLDLLSY